jgi:hypothetical protein
MLQFSAGLKIQAERKLDIRPTDRRHQTMLAPEVCEHGV